MTVDRPSRSRGELLEKKIYKSALLETVEVLNKNADEKDSCKKKKRKSVDEEASGENGIPWIIKKPKVDPYRTTEKKQKRNQEAKAMHIQKRQGKQDTKHYENIQTEEHSKKTRKERKQEKISGRGHGISSKEYYEKFVKKERSTNVQSARNSDKKQNSDANDQRSSRDSFASKRKTDFPANAKGRQGSKSNDGKKRNTSHKKR